jgi:hypothetical protein
MCTALLIINGIKAAASLKAVDKVLYKLDKG